MTSFPVQSSPRIRVGVDIVSVERMKRLCNDNPGILDTVLTSREAVYCWHKRRCYEHIAARFAAKEAVLKAFGTGLAQGMDWTDVEIVNDDLGKPRVYLSGRVAVMAHKRGLVDLDVSLAHTHEMAMAHVVAIWENNGEITHALSAC